MRAPAAMVFYTRRGRCGDARSMEARLSASLARISKSSGARRIWRGALVSASLENRDRWEVRSSNRSESCTKMPPRVAELRIGSARNARRMSDPPEVPRPGPSGAPRADACHGAQRSERDPGFSLRDKRAIDDLAMRRKLKEPSVAFRLSSHHDLAEITALSFHAFRAAPIISGRWPCLMTEGRVALGMRVRQSSPSVPLPIRAVSCPSHPSRGSADPDERTGMSLAATRGEDCHWRQRAGALRGRLSFAFPDGCTKQGTRRTAAETLIGVCGLRHRHGLVA